MQTLGKLAHPPVLSWDHQTQVAQLEGAARLREKEVARAEKTGEAARADVTTLQEQVRDQGWAGL